MVTLNGVVSGLLREENENFSLNWRVHPKPTAFLHAALRFRIVAGLSHVAGIFNVLGQVLLARRSGKK